MSNSTYELIEMYTGMDKEEFFNYLKNDIQMNINDFFEYIKKEAAETNILAICDTYGIQYEYTSRIYKFVACPFHGGSIKDRDANVHERHNGFKCYSCSGNGSDKGLKPVNFVMKLQNIEYLAAVIDIAYRTGKICPTGITKKKPADVKIVPSESAKRRVVKTNQIAPVEVLDKVLRVFRQGNALFKGQSKLSEEHVQYLKKRHLTDEDIADGKYFTLPQLSILPAILYVLKNKYNLGEEALEYIPGFYRNEKGEITFKTFNAIGIPIIDSRLRCRGIQIRLNKEIVYTKANGKVERLRYIWLSSEEIPEGCSCGVSPGAPVDVTYPKTPRSEWSKNLFITEGKFKAQQLSKFTNAIVISVQGVSNWRECIQEIKEIQELTDNLIKRIFVCYDADISYKTQVNLNATNMSDELEKQFTDIPVFYCLWNPNDGKGIDDLIFNSKTNTIKMVQKRIYDKFYKLLIKNIKEEGLDFEDFSEEEKLELFITCIYNRVS